VGQNEGMTRYRARTVLLLFGMLHLSACQTWQSVSLDAISPAQLIEEDRPDRVRVTGGGLLELEVVSPSIEGDQLMGAGDVAVPLEDILRLEVRETSIGRSIGFGWLVAAVAGLVIQGVACLDSPEDCS
jgi:hypothetical protein